MLIPVQKLMSSEHVIHESGHRVHIRPHELPGLQLLPPIQKRPLATGIGLVLVDNAIVLHHIGQSVLMERVCHVICRRQQGRMNSQGSIHEQHLAEASQHRAHFFQLLAEGVLEFGGTTDFLPHGVCEDLVVASNAGDAARIGLNLAINGLPYFLDLGVPSQDLVPDVAHLCELLVDLGVPGRVDRLLLHLDLLVDGLVDDRGLPLDRL